MSEKRRGLGRGLGALIPSNAAPMTRPVGERPVDVFFPDRDPGEEGADGNSPAVPSAASNLTVLPGGRTATGGGDGAHRPAPGMPGAAPPARPEAVPEAPAARLAPAPASMPAVVPGAIPRPGGPLPPSGHVTSEGPASVPPAVPPSAPATWSDPAGAGSASDRAARSGPELVPVPGATFAELPVSGIRPNARQPRQVFDEEELAELVHSIKEVGVLQPVVVRRVADEDDEARFELIMGERRLRAARDAGLERIPCIVRDTQDDAMLRDALLENLHRSQLNPLEEAAAYQQLLDDFGCTHEELAGRIGRSRPQISNTLRLLKLPPLVQRRLAAGVLSAGHARALLGLEDQAAMERLAQRIVAEGLSVRAVEEIVALGDGPTVKPAKRRPRPGAHTSELDELAARLGDQLDTRVAIALGRNKGRLSIDFASVEDLNRIIGLLGPEVRGVFQRS
ncbi:MAG TPA: ParB/RepB/Spo0J family partition protein [Kineosporiaceae bacterium]